MSARPTNEAAEPRSLPDPLEAVLQVVEDHKGEDLVLLDLRAIATFTDYMLLCSGRNERQVKAIVDAIEKKLGEAGLKALHTEGYQEASWVLIDYVDFLVNVFVPETRQFYQLERVWRDAPVLRGVREETAATTESTESPAAGGDAPAG